MLKNISLAALLLMALALAGLVVRGAFLSSHPLAMTAEVASLALMIWARLTFGMRSLHAAANPSAGGLVTTGPYRYIRHPIYTAACLFGWSGVLAHWSMINGILGLLLLAAAVVRMFCEERLIVAEHPEYADYALATRRMVPFIF
jgi:protein-S-isoprenylcysteine O-methyltransferase Ste14